MKRGPVTLAELRRAYYDGLMPGDAVVLEDIGIPVTPDDFERHVQAGREVRALSGDGSPVPSKTVRGLGVFCADCSRDILPGRSCPHFDVNKSGEIR